MQKVPAFTVTSRTQVKQRANRASYDRASAHAILDEALVAAVGFVDEGQPFVIPMAFARDGEQLLLHGSSKSRLQLLLAEGAPVCVTVTLLDGLVLARSAMHHSVNYRSVVVLGRPAEIVEESAKRAALERLVDHVLSGRSQATRAPNAVELKATRVFAVPLEEVSVKARTGGPIDDEEDLQLSHWAGVIPLTLSASAPIPDPLHAPLAAVPLGAQAYTRGALEVRS
jgi:uncharacterized protein